MCGIIAAASTRNVVKILINGLKSLEYRGYDSAGLTVVDNTGDFLCQKAVGKVNALDEKIKSLTIDGNIGIAHTRWATHGKPNAENAHPHISYDSNISLVHNGVIENYAEIKQQLISQGIKFYSETDSEVIANLFASKWDISISAISNIMQSVKLLKGAYSLAVLHKSYPNKIISVRSGSPLIIGHGENENFISSDVSSLLSKTQKFTYLEEGDIAIIDNKTVEIYNEFGKSKETKISVLDFSPDHASKDGYKHFMLKEIYEQPKAIRDTLQSALNGGDINFDYFGDNSKSLFKNIEHIKIVACGTSYHAGIVAKHWIEQHVKISCDVEIASEIRYRESVVLPKSLLLLISQSGETADILAALTKLKKENYQATMSICNVANSSLAREVDLSFITKAGMEISVASTKAFTTQLTSLLLFTVALMQSKDFDKITSDEIIDSLISLPEDIQEVLSLNKDISLIAPDFQHKNDCIFLGRGISFPIALEGALKLKELSYINANACPAGELKHGSLALIDDEMPIIVIAPNDNLIEKLESNMQEVESRGGNLYVFTDDKRQINSKSRRVILLGRALQITSPIIFTIPMQLLSYHVALIKGTDVDQPRNLAKSVTVE